MAGVRNYESARFNFKMFANRKDFVDSGNEAWDYLYANITGTMSLQSRDVRNALTRMADEKKFNKPSDLEDGLAFFDEMVSTIDMGGTFKKVRLKITDDKRGIFDFGLASKGLYNPSEYFSQELADELPDEFSDDKYGNKLPGIVPINFIKEVYVLNEKQFWYTSFNNGKSYALTKQKEGQRSKDLMLPNAKYVFRTSNKKSYLMFEKKGGKAKMVELYIPLHQSIKLSTVMPLFLAAKFLQKYGVQTRINTLRIYRETGREWVGWGYPVKDYGDEMDFNFIALNTADSRWWYSVQAVVRAMNEKFQVVAAQGGLKTKVNDSSIYKYSASGSAPSGRENYVEYFSRFRNWYTDEIKKGNLPPLRVDKKLVLLGGAFDAPSNARAAKDEIMVEFHRILDTVDFQFNKPELVAQRIFKRLVEDKMQEFYKKEKAAGTSSAEIAKKMKREKTRLKAEFKTYCQGLLLDTYAYPVGGEYAEEKESAEKLDKELDQKIEKLNEYLETV